ncbi:MAG: hypothetical protein ACK4ZY_09330 [Sphingomonas sp.]
MLHPALPLSLLALAAPTAAALADPADQLDGVEMAQMTIHERIVIRLPRMSPARTSLTRAAPVPAPVRFKEKKGPKCVAVTDMGGAMIAEPGAVDLILAGGKRLRARLDDDCGPMDFYNGFYLRPAADGKVCADRDTIRMRSGISCRITTFRTLIATR